MHVRLARAFALHLSLSPLTLAGCALAHERPAVDAGSAPTSDAAMTPDAAVIAPTPVARRLSATFEHICFIRGDGALFCWGNGRGAALGTADDDTFHTTPVRLDPEHAHVAVSAGIGVTCTVRASGELVCWGRNTSGSLATGDGLTHPSPVAIDDSRDWVDVAVGSGLACGLHEGGAMDCWGGPNDGWAIDQHEPLPEGVLRRPTPIAGSYEAVSNSWYTTTALGRDGTLWQSPNDGVFVRETRVEHVEHIGEGVHATIAADADGRPSVLRYEGVFPVTIPDGERVVAADAAYFGCVLTESGRVHCLDVDSSVGTPSEVPLAAPAVAIAVAYNFACALDTAEEVFCWALSSRTSPYSTVPTRVAFE